MKVAAPVVVDIPRGQDTFLLCFVMQSLELK